jgi:hypothetical protein
MVYSTRAERYKLGIGLQTISRSGTLSASDGTLNGLLEPYGVVKKEV